MDWEKVTMLSETSWIVSRNNDNVDWKVSRNLVKNPAIDCEWFYFLQLGGTFMIHSYMENC